MCAWQSLFFFSGQQTSSCLQMFSKFQTSSGSRGGALNKKSLLQKKSEALSDMQVRQVFDLECACEPMCTWLLMNDVDNPLETLLDIFSESPHGYCKSGRDAEVESPVVEGVGVEGRGDCVEFNHR